MLFLFSIFGKIIKIFYNQEAYLICGFLDFFYPIRICDFFLRSKICRDL